MDEEVIEEKIETRGRTKKRQRTGQRSKFTPRLNQQTPNEIIRNKKMILRTAHTTYSNNIQKLQQLLTSKTSFDQTKIRVLEDLTTLMSEDETFSEYCADHISISHTINKQNNIINEVEPLIEEMEFCINRVAGLDKFGNPPPLRRAKTEDGEDRGVVGVLLRSLGMLK